MREISSVYLPVYSWLQVAEAVIKVAAYRNKAVLKCYPTHTHIHTISGRRAQTLSLPCWPSRGDNVRDRRINVLYESHAMVNLAATRKWAGPNGGSTTAHSPIPIPEADNTLVIPPDM
ncbi:hypothetical protein EVAR_97725_1 [Eumeta japonica]|uniref:Uncharacterized protein n=1 Tax=Eumeta variegata TaxID=151549 RepID=A0A4C1XZE1_EUMVA|nr:hypothetical protein EVAR_97725_1 [Eumeta japonica]